MTLGPPDCSSYTSVIGLWPGQPTADGRMFLVNRRETAPVNLELMVKRRETWLPNLLCCDESNMSSRAEDANIPAAFMSLNSFVIF